MRHMAQAPLLYQQVANKQPDIGCPPANLPTNFRYIGSGPNWQNHPADL
ncbi:hypothetical protein Cadr_000012574 [Camelus dromedarius]|uniref:Uncharacterized protein n=1 Tax=Camelus dromedarius TaxID=9838 RepID=A0A5N4D8X1_CAMDR|nr:hypothetical protein Cadr_000012574 [Camelus dromedarius]